MKAKEQKSGSGRGLAWIVLVMMAISLPGAMMTSGQGIPSMTPALQATNAALVTINVDNGPITQVLNAFSRQTGRNIVVGSEVTGNVTLRVTDIQWQAALDVILKPYGYDYYMVGDTIIICGVDKLPKGVPLSKADGTASVAVTNAPVVKVVEPLVVKVFNLKYLDALDVEELVRGQLSPAGKTGRILSRSQSWQDQQVFQGTLNTTSSESLGRLKRLQEDAQHVRGKTLVVVDTQKVLDQVDAMIKAVDVMPAQIQIEARFVEVRADLLRDIGVEWGTGVNGASTPGVQTISTKGAGKLYAAGGQQISGTVKPSGFDPQSTGLQGLTGVRPFNGGLSLAFQKLTDLQLEMLLHLLQEDVSYNMLSSPKVLTMDNQDAVIIVGQKLPIIKSDSSGGLGTTTISTSLERYEDIGIKLKVLPQVCDKDFINLIVHPSVRELLGYQSGKVGVTEGSASGGTVSLTEYPVVATREAETQILIKDGQTIVIGGMLRDKKQTTQIKVPFLGSIPFLGVLFRRETVNTEKVELLIFLTAKVRDTTEELAVKMPEGQSIIKVEKIATPAKP